MHLTRLRNAPSSDIAKLISFFFRSTPATDASQILDMATVQEMHNPVIVTPDGQSGFGTPLELAYDTTAPYWSLSKVLTLRKIAVSVVTSFHKKINFLRLLTNDQAGQLPGYRSQMALIPPLKLGVFVCALNTTVPDDPTLVRR